MLNAVLPDYRRIKGLFFSLIPMLSSLYCAIAESHFNAVCDDNRLLKGGYVVIEAATLGRLPE